MGLKFGGEEKSVTPRIPNLLFELTILLYLKNGLKMALKGGQINLTVRELGKGG